jgi:hypothetical protein
MPQPLKLLRAPIKLNNCLIINPFSLFAHKVEKNKLSKVSENNKKALP